MEQGAAGASRVLAEDCRTELNNERTREKLSSALRLLMGRKAYSKIDVGSIAAASGLTRKSFYYHFASKDELMEYLIRKDIAACEEDGNGWEVLLAIARCMDGRRAFYRSAGTYHGLRALIMPAIIRAASTILMIPPGDPSCTIAAAVFIDRLSWWMAAPRPLDPVSFILSYRTDLLKFSGACLGKLQA